MKRILMLTLTVGLLYSGVAFAQKNQEEPRGTENIAYKWGKMALDATASDT